MDSEVEKLLEKGTESKSLAPETEEQIWGELEESIEAGDVPDLLQEADAAQGEVPSSSGAGQSASSAGGAAGAGGGGGTAFQLGGLSLSSGVLKVVGVSGVVAVLGTGVWINSGAEKADKATSNQSNGSKIEKVVNFEPVEPKHVQYAPVVERTKKKDDSEERSEEPVTVEKSKPSQDPPTKGGEKSGRKSRDSGATETPKRPTGLAKESPTYNLSAERKLVSQAREALDKDRFQKTENFLDRHESKFPDGQLAEQRDVLRIQTLQQSGSNEQARQRASTFLEEYPNSILSGSVSEILSELEQEK